MHSTAEHYGIKNINSCNNVIDKIVEEIYHVGYTIVSSNTSPKDIEDYRQRLDNAYQMQQAEVGGEENLVLINDANVVRCVLAYDEIFLKLATHPVLLDVCQKILGSNFVLLMQNGIINRPNDIHYQTKWHRDLNYQHWICSKPLAISFLYCVDDFSIATGGTRLLPGSHLKENFPSEEYVKQYEKTVEAPAGSMLIFDSMLFHCARQNTSSMIRRAINHVIGTPILSQQINIPEMLNGRFREDAFLEKYLGYTWNPKHNVKEWRLRRLKLLGKQHETNI